MECLLFESVNKDRGCPEAPGVQLSPGPPQEWRPAPPSLTHMQHIQDVLPKNII